MEIVDFTDTIFRGIVLFDCASFGSAASFSGASLGHYCSFSGAAFADIAFRQTRFEGPVDFTGKTEEQWARAIAILNAYEFNEEAGAELEEQRIYGIIMAPGLTDFYSYGSRTPASIP